MAIIIKTEVNFGQTAIKLNNLVTKSEELVKKLKAVNKELRETAKLANQVNTAFGKMGSGVKMPSGGSSGGGSRVGGAGGGGSAKPPKTAEELFTAYAARRQQQEQFRDRYRKLYETPKPPKTPMSEEEQYERYASKRDQSQRFRERYESGQPQQNPLVRALMRSRVSSSGSIMPLVGDLVKGNPRLAAALMVLQLGKNMAESGAEVQRANASIYAQGGGNYGQVAAVSTVSSGLKFDASGLGRNLTQGYAPWVAAMAGVNPVGGPFGDMDYNKKSIRILELIAKAGEKNFNEARKIAEAVGQPDAAKFALLSKNTQQQILSMQNETSKPYVGAIEYDAQVARAQQHLAKSFDFVYHWAADALNLLNNITQGWDDLWGGGQGKDHADAIKQNTNALNNMAKFYQEGVSGGPNAKGAASWNMQYQMPGRTFTPYGML